MGCQLTSKISDGHCAARPRTWVRGTVSLLNLEGEEAVASGADSIATSACDSSLVEASLKDQECFVQVRAYYLAQTSDHLAIG
jgi:hypothetical protein